MNIGNCLERIFKENISRFQRTEMLIKLMKEIAQVKNRTLIFSYQLFTA